MAAKKSSSDKPAKAARPEKSIEARLKAAQARDRKREARENEIKDRKRDSLAQWAALPFREQLQARAAAIDETQRVTIERLVSSHFNGSLKYYGGPEARLVSLSPFQLAFMDLLHPLRYDEIIAPAQQLLESYYEGSRAFAMREFTADVQFIRLPTETSDQWEIRFARTFDGAVVVCEMNGWEAKSTVLVG